MTDMTNVKLIVKEIEQVPESFLGEILDFIRFLKEKNNMDQLETMIASESALKKDWMRPEEDEAWRDL
jgi:predicted ArsR family transcriptional regulator